MSLVRLTRVRALPYGVIGTAFLVLTAIGVVLVLGFPVVLVMACAPRPNRRIHVLPSKYRLSLL